MYLQNKAVCLCKCKQGKAHVFIATAMSCSRWNLLRIFIRYVALYIFKNVRKIFLKVKEKRKKWQEFLKNAKNVSCIYGGHCRCGCRRLDWLSSFLLLLLLCAQRPALPP